MSNEMLASVWVSAVIVPFLHSKHFSLDLGNQRGIDPAQTSSIDQETVCHLFPDQGQDFALDLPHIPLILGQESLPTGDVPVHKKADSGYIGHTFTALSKEHEGQREALKIRKIVCTKNWSEKSDVGKNSTGEECIHNFASLDGRLRSFSDTSSLQIYQFLYLCPKVQKHSLKKALAMPSIMNVMRKNLRRTSGRYLRFVSLTRIPLIE